MRKLLPLLLLFLTFFLFSSASAQTTVLVEQYMNYMCGDQFEISFPDVISTSTMVSNASRVQALASENERLLQIRVKLRNMTTETFTGMNMQSFKLTGYIRDRSLDYYPEQILKTDYFGSGVYYTYDKLPPLRMIDFLLIFRVNPLLINWELSFEPVMSSGQTYQLHSVTYEPMEWEPCKALFQFPAVRTLETGELTRFIRKEK